jgi:hypothetical protein
VLAASGHLTDRDRELIRLTARLRVLTTGQLAALGFGSVITARQRLALLVKLGMLRRFRPRVVAGSAPWHYVLGPVGAAMLGTEDRDEKKWAPQVRADRQLALERSQRLGHMTGVNWFFVQLARHAREPGGELWWKTEQEAAEHLYLTRWDAESRPHPDAMGIWADGGTDIVFFLEYDTGTEHLRQLTDKLPGYAEMARVNMTFQVPILFCFPTPRRDQSARKAMAGTAASRALQIATAALDPAVACPACGAAWMTLHGGHGPMRLIGLDDVLPDPWRTARAEDERRERERREQECRDLAVRQPGTLPDDEPDDLLWPYGR